MGIDLETTGIVHAIDHRNTLARSGNRHAVNLPPKQHRGLPGLGPALFGIALVVLLLELGISHAGAQDATPETDLPQPLLDFAAAWSSGDPDQVVALFTTDGVFDEAVLNGAMTTNHDDLRAYATAVFAAFPDFKVTPVDGFHSGDRAVLEWILTGTYRGSFGDLPPGTGQPIEVRVASVFTYEGDLIARDVEYWDVATLLAQVGVLPG